MLQNYGHIFLIRVQEIEFAHSSFKWKNNAKGNAGVTVIIVGVRNISAQPKFIFTESVSKLVKNISPYLIEGKDLYVKKRTIPLSNFPRMEYGNMAIDGGNLIFSSDEKSKLLSTYPDAKMLFKKVIGAQEFLNGNERWCLWITDEKLEFAQSIPEINQRIEFTKEFRLSSSDKGTHKIASRPHQFREMKESNNTIFIPTVTSERREYIPIDFLSVEKNVIAPNQAIYNGEPWVFGFLHSRMHVVWLKTVGGRLKTDYRYSAQLCYNTFPFPEINDKQKHTIAQYVFAILDERAKYPEKTMAWMYNPETMPSGLKQAHHELDMAIEKIYRLTPFRSDEERLEYLFKQYEEMIKKETLFAKQKKTRSTRKIK